MHHPASLQLLIGSAPQYGSSSELGVHQGMTFTENSPKLWMDLCYTHTHTQAPILSVNQRGEEKTLAFPPLFISRGPKSQLQVALGECDLENQLPRTERWLCCPEGSLEPSLPRRHQVLGPPPARRGPLSFNTSLHLNC